MRYGAILLRSTTAAQSFSLSRAIGENGSTGPGQPVPPSGQGPSEVCTREGRAFRTSSGCKEINAVQRGDDLTSSQ